MIREGVARVYMLMLLHLQVRSRSLLISARSLSFQTFDDFSVARTLVLLVPSPVDVGEPSVLGLSLVLGVAAGASEYLVLLTWGNLLLLQLGLLSHLAWVILALSVEESLWA